MPAKKKEIRKVVDTLPNSLLEPKDINADVLCTAYCNAYIDARIDVDGELSLILDKINVNVRVLEAEPMLLLYAIWPLNSHVPRTEFLKLTNDINDHMPLVRCAIPALEEGETPYLWVDYTIYTKGGLTTRELVAATKTFTSSIADGLSRFGSSGLFAQD